MYENKSAGENDRYMMQDQGGVEKEREEERVSVMVLAGKS